MSDLDTHAKAGIAAINERRYEDAVREFQAALAIDDGRPDLNSALGMAYLQRGEVGSAIPHLEKAVALSEPFDAPEHQEMKLHFRVGLASAYEMADQIGDARRTLQATVAKWPAQPEPQLQLAHLLFKTGAIDEGLTAYRAAADHLDDEGKKVVKAVIEAVGAFRESEHDAGIILLGHASSYSDYFDGIAEDLVKKGWYAEAARMARGADGEVKPLIPQGARPYAMQRVDLADPRTGEVSSVYNEKEAMIVALNGLEPLAQMEILFPWPGQPFETLVSTHAPWHWLPIILQTHAKLDEKALATLDDAIGDWYLSGFNGDFGDKDSGRFHFVSDPEQIGDNAVQYVFDLGRAKVEAIGSLLRRLAIVHERLPLRRVILGRGRVAE